MPEVAFHDGKFAGFAKSPYLCSLILCMPQKRKRKANHNNQRNMENEIKITRVENNKDLGRFIDFYYDLYKDCKNAVPFLRFDEMETLRKDKNPSFDFCDAEYYLAWKDGKIVGRVAAIINRRANEQWQKKQVRFGWFDFIDDQRVSKALLEKVEEFGRGKGMTEIAGPLGFTDMDREGMMVQGYEYLSTMYVIYNYPYYVNHIEALGGYEKANDWMEYRIKVPEVTPPKFAKTAQLIEQRYNLHAHRFSSSELVEHGMGHRLFEILNETYAHLYDFQQLSDKQINQLIDSYIKKADLNLVVGVVDKNVTLENASPEERNEVEQLGGKLVGFGISFPSFSRALQKTRRGRLLPFGWWHVLKVLKWHKTDTVDLLLIGVLPEYRVKGANSIIFNHLIEKYRQYGFKWAEAMPMMESNTKVRSQWQYLDSEVSRVRRCFSKKI